MTPQIIGISGKTGSGKTTLAQALAQALATSLQATFLSWDDFDELSQGPEDYVDWYHRGQNYNEWKYDVLAEVLHALKSGQSIIHPALQNKLNPTTYIIFDAPLGRLHDQTGQYIDICIHIDVPLDVLLARRIIRDFSARDKTKDDVLKEVAFYLYHARPLFFDDSLKLNADLIVDGMLSTGRQVRTIEGYLRVHFS